METKILKQDNIAVFRRVCRSLRWFADAIMGKGNRLSQQSREVFGDRRETVLINALTLRTSEMRRQDYARTCVCRVANRRNRGADPLVIGHLSVFDWNVEVDSDKDAFAFEVEVADG